MYSVCIVLVLVSIVLVLEYSVKSIVRFTSSPSLFTIPDTVPVALYVTYCQSVNEQ